MKLPPATERYDRAREDTVQRELQREDARNRKKGEHIELVTEFLILKSPNGARWKLTVGNTGMLTAVAL